MALPQQLEALMEEEGSVGDAGEGELATEWLDKVRRFCWGIGFRDLGFRV
jgi:hypothetical protein